MKALFTAAVILIAAVALLACSPDDRETNQRLSSIEQKLDQALSEPPQAVVPDARSLQQDAAQRTLQACSDGLSVDDLGRIVGLILLDVELGVAESLLELHIEALTDDVEATPSRALALSMDRIFVLPASLQHQYQGMTGGSQEQLAPLLADLGEALYALQPRFAALLGLWGDLQAETDATVWGDLLAEIRALRFRADEIFALLSEACASGHLARMLIDHQGEAWQLLVLNAVVGRAFVSSCLAIDCFGGGGLGRLGEEHPYVQWNQERLRRDLREMAVVQSRSNALERRLPEGWTEELTPLAASSAIRGALLEFWIGEFPSGVKLTQRSTPFDPLVLQSAFAQYARAVMESWSASGGPND